MRMAAAAGAMTSWVVRWTAADDNLEATPSGRKQVQSSTALPQRVAETDRTAAMSALIDSLGRDRIGD